MKIPFLFGLCTAANRLSGNLITNLLRFIFKLSTDFFPCTRSCPITPLTACYLKYTCYTNISTCKHSVSPLVQSQVSADASFARTNQRAVSRIFPLLLWVVRLKSNKYQPERLTSVSHFKRTTAEITFGLLLD